MAEVPQIPRHELVEMNNAINKVRASAEAQLMAIPGVVAVGVGLKQTRGEFKAKLCFKVTVLQKKDKSEIPAAQLIPPVVFGFETDVVEIPPPGSSTIIADENKYRPLIGGCQVQPSFVQTQATATGQVIFTSFGTMGCLAKVNTGTHNGKIVGLTCWHVAIKSTAAANGERLGQPTHNQCCTCCACNEIGKVINAQLDNTIDAAIFLLNGQDSDTTPDFRYVNEILDIGIIAGSAVYLAGETVYKRGRTTGLTKGTITNDNYTTSAVTYNQGFPDQTTHTFPGQLEITPVTAGTRFADSGDSGSVLVNTHNQVIGLIFGADLTAGTGIAHKIATVTSALHIDIIDSTFHSAAAGKEGVPLSSISAVENLSPALALEELESEVMRFSHGKKIFDLFKTHRVELLNLINHQREVMAAWNRYQGPAFLANIARSIRRENKPVPEQINGITLQNLLLKMTAVLQRHGSPGLAKAVSENYLGIMDVLAAGNSPDAWKSRLAQLENNFIR